MKTARICLLKYNSYLIMTHHIHIAQIVITLTCDQVDLVELLQSVFPFFTLFNIKET